VCSRCSTSRHLGLESSLSHFNTAYLNTYGTAVTFILRHCCCRHLISAFKYSIHSAHLKSYLHFSWQDLNIIHHNMW
jgi:hypothetical protein